MQPKISRSFITVFIVVGLALLIAGIVLLIHDSRFAGLAFALVGVMSGGVSLFVLIQASKQRERAVPRQPCWPAPVAGPGTVCSSASTTPFCRALDLADTTVVTDTFLDLLSGAAGYVVADAAV